MAAVNHRRRLMSEFMQELLQLHNCIISALDHSSDKIMIVGFYVGNPNDANSLHVGTWNAEEFDKPAGFGECWDLVYE